jgi:hypothetical protein
MKGQCFYMPLICVGETPNNLELERPDGTIMMLSKASVGKWLIEAPDFNPQPQNVGVERE